MKALKINQKLTIEKKVIAQLDSNQMRTVQGGKQANKTTSKQCSYWSCACTHKGCTM